MDYSVPRLFKNKPMKVFKLFFQTVAVGATSAYLTAALILQEFNLFNWPKELLGMFAFIFIAFIIFYFPVITMIKLFQDL